MAARVVERRIVTVLFADLVGFTSRATESLLRARLLLACGDDLDGAGAAERSLAELGERAPWWRAKAIRVLEQAGAASADLLEEARKIESRLGIRPN